MLDNQLIQIFYPIITQGLVDYGIPDVSVRQANQPSQTGTLSTNFVSFFKVLDKRYGWNKRLGYYDVDSEVYRHIEEQLYESTFQVNAYAVQNPDDINSLTASDIINTVSEIFQSDKTIQQLIDNNVGILKISDIRNAPFTDDREQFEYSPSFDFTLRHIQERSIISDYITDIESIIVAI